jgi:hypothetical protein
VTHRLGDRDAVGDVVAADHDHRQVRAVRRGQAGQLGHEHRRLGPDLGDGPQPHAAPGGLREPGGQPGAERLLWQLRAQPGRDGVAQDEEVEHGAVLLLVLPVRPERLLAERLADEPARRRRLTVQQATPQQHACDHHAGRGGTEDQRAAHPASCDRWW